MRAQSSAGLIPAHVELGRLLSRIERNTLTPAEQERLRSVPGMPGRRVGITGSPGVGKSSLINHLIALYRSANTNVGVVAVDPTSPFSGGAVLGDRIRFTSASKDEGVFVRSLASHGSLGGVAPSASLVAAALEAAGFSQVLIETVGVGQTGYDIICLADTVVAVFSPESGDSVQLLKAGILEVGDIYVVNKCDRPGADLLVREIRLSLDQAPTAGDLLHHGRSATAPAGPGSAQNAGWTPPVISTNSQDGTGVDVLLRAISQHQAYLAALGPDHPRTARRIERELAFTVQSRLSALIEHNLRAEIVRLAAAVAQGTLSQWSAAEQLLARVNIK